MAEIVARSGNGSGNSWNRYSKAIPPSPPHEYGQGMEYFLMGLSVVTAIAGIGIAYRMYVQQPALSDRVANALAAASQALAAQVLHR